MLMSWLASRCGNAVASSATRLIAPPKLKIGTVESGLLIVAQVLADRVDHVAGERAQAVRLPVVVPPVRHRRVEELLVRDVGLGRDRVEHRVAEGADRGQHPLALLDRAGVRRHQRR